MGEWGVTGGVGKVVRIVLDYVQVGERVRGMRDVEVRAMLESLERDIFTVVRCQDPTGTTQHGSSAAQQVEQPSAEVVTATR